jgi:hypothetical protein
VYVELCAWSVRGPAAAASTAAPVMKCFRIGLLLRVRSAADYSSASLLLTP